MAIYFPRVDYASWFVSGALVTPPRRVARKSERGEHRKAGCRLGDGGHCGCARQIVALLLPVPCPFCIQLAKRAASNHEPYVIGRLALSPPLLITLYSYDPSEPDRDMPAVLTAEQPRISSSPLRPQPPEPAGGESLRTVACDSRC
jgi:hypothetical protein